MTRMAFLAAVFAASTAAAQTPPAKLRDVTMSSDATRRAHLQEINLETARKLADACVAFSRAANPNGGASGGDEECGHAALEKVLGPQPPIVTPVRPSPVGPAAPPAGAGR